jgi:hypothetical protein
LPRAASAAGSGQRASLVERDEGVEIWLGLGLRDVGTDQLLAAQTPGAQRTCGWLALSVGMSRSAEGFCAWALSANPAKAKAANRVGDAMFIEGL